MCVLKWLSLLAGAPIACAQAQGSTEGRTESGHYSTDHHHPRKAPHSAAVAHYLERLP